MCQIVAEGSDCESEQLERLQMSREVGSAKEELRKKKRKKSLKEIEKRALRYVE